MSTEDCIAALDDALRDAPEITLRRVIGAGATASNVDCPGVKARIEPLKGTDIVGTVTQDSDLVIISPTQIRQKQWPNAVTPQFPQYPWLPQKNDKAIISGRVRTISFVKYKDPFGEVVRIELTVAG